KILSSCLAIALCSTRRSPSKNLARDALRPDTFRIAAQSGGSQKRRLGVGLGSFFACEKNRTRLLTRAAPCGLTPVSCPAAFVRRGDAASAEKTIRSLTRPVSDRLEPAAQLSRWPRIGRN